MTSTPGPTQLRGQDCSVSLERANVLTIAVLAPTCAVVLALAYWVRWGVPSLMEVAQGLGGALEHGLAFVLAYGVVLLLSMIAHEGLHAVGFRYVAGLPWKEIRLGIHGPTLSPYASTQRPLRVGAYRWIVALPALVLGILPALIALTHGGWLLMAYAFLMLTLAGGDILILWLLRGVPPGSRVLDHPERAGCLVLPEPNQ